MKLNLPTKITLVRLFLIPVFMAVFFIEAIPYRYAVAAAIFVLAAATDALDGHIARSRNLVTTLGKNLDPIADKVLISTAMILLLVMKDSVCAPFGSVENLLYASLAVCVCIIMARELIISAFRQIAASNGVIMAADKLGKLKTIFQDIAIFGILFFAGIASLFETWMIWHTYLLAFALVIFGIATILTIWSGIAYVVNNKQVLKDA